MKKLNPYVLFVIVLVIAIAVLGFVGNWAESVTSSPEIAFLITLVALVVLFIVAFGKRLKGIFKNKK
jgi:hypothetical protein